MNETVVFVPMKLKHLPVNNFKSIFRTKITDTHHPPLISVTDIPNVKPKSAFDLINLHKWAEYLFWDNTEEKQSKKPATDSIVIEVLAHGSITPSEYGASDHDSSHLRSIIHTQTATSPNFMRKAYLDIVPKQLHSITGPYLCIYVPLASKSRLFHRRGHIYSSTQSITSIGMLMLMSEALITETASVPEVLYM